MAIASNDNVTVPGWWTADWWNDCNGPINYELEKTYWNIDDVYYNLNIENMHTLTDTYIYIYTHMNIQTYNLAIYYIYSAY